MFAANTFFSHFSQRTKGLRRREMLVTFSKNLNSRSENSRSVPASSLVVFSIVSSNKLLHGSGYIADELDYTIYYALHCFYNFSEVILASVGFETPYDLVGKETRRPSNMHDGPLHIPKCVVTEGLDELRDVKVKGFRKTTFHWSHCIVGENWTVLKLGIPEDVDGWDEKVGRSVD